MNKFGLKLVGVIAFVILTVALLVGNRLGLVFAGGQGYQAPMSFMVGEVVNSNAPFFYPRGSAVETKAGEWIQVVNGGLVVWLYENTRLEITTLTDETVELHLPYGRIIVANNASASREVTVVAGDKTTTFSANQVLSIVNYSFLDKVDVFPITDDLKNSAAKDFYAWYTTSQTIDGIPE